jgi:hypothetical protein
MATKERKERKKGKLKNRKRKNGENMVRARGVAESKPSAAEPAS